MRRRSLLSLYHLTGRVWLTAAALSLLLPADVRLALWLPLHLALAGAVSAAISGSMQTFAAGLTGAPDPPRRLVLVQFSFVTIGAALVAAGLPARAPWSVATGGASFAGAVVLLGVIVAWCYRRGLNRRFRVVFLFYGAAAAAVLTGVAIGALLGTGAVADAEVRLGLRDAHMVVNVLGWATLTIAGTLVTFLPTVLRVQIPPWRAGPTALFMLLGVALFAAGQAWHREAVAAAGALSLLAGAFGIAMLAVGAVRTPRRHFLAVSAKHLVMALLWFAAGCAALAVHALRAAFGDQLSSLTLSGFRDTFLVMFVAGWILQTLLGAWLYLLPAQRIGGPAERKLLLAGVEHLATLQVVMLNVGLILIAVRASGGPAWMMPVGSSFALAGGAMALLKAWTFGRLARLASTARLADRLFRRL